MFCTEQRTDLVACMCTGEPCAAIVKLEAKSKNWSRLGAYVLLFYFIPSFYSIQTKIEYIWAWPWVTLFWWCFISIYCFTYEMTWLKHHQLWCWRPFECTFKCFAVNKDQEKENYILKHSKYLFAGWWIIKEYHIINVININQYQFILGLLALMISIITNYFIDASLCVM